MASGGVLICEIQKWWCGSLKTEITKGPERSKYLRSPWLESILMIVTVAVSYVCLAIISSTSTQPVGGGEMPTSTIVLILFSFFMLSVAIALIAVIAGIGGGVLVVAGPLF